MLQEILYNLCDNAIKYNVPGGSVTIHAENNRLTVSDTGIGIPPEHKDRIFERFYRVDKSHSKASGGTGLGLSIVKHAVACHNAEIGLESTPDKGTTVTVQF
jgi:two-component system phosphate regulon sensor histidine kinase PhoR